MAYFFIARPAQTRFPLAAVLVALFRRLPLPRRKTAEEHLAAQIRREAARCAADTLLR